jgi:hypothetical protein
MLEQSIAGYAVSSSAIALLDSNDRVVAFNESWRQIVGEGNAINPGCSLAEIAAGITGLVEWVGKEQEGRREFFGLGQHWQASLLVMRGAQPHRLLVIQLEPGKSEIDGPEDGYVKIRHDIKNRIGGLKLYATFLKRKLNDQAELLEVVGKMIASLDQMTVEANLIKKLEGEGK